MGSTRRICVQNKNENYEIENPSEKIRRIVSLIKRDIQVFRQAFLSIIKIGMNELENKTDQERRIHG